MVDLIYTVEKNETVYWCIQREFLFKKWERHQNFIPDFIFNCFNILHTIYSTLLWICTFLSRFKIKVMILLHRWSMLIICMIFRITISIAGCMAYMKIIRFCKTFWKLYFLIPIENEIIDQMYFEIILKVNMIKVNSILDIHVHVQRLKKQP